jgi:hypothetical protein
VFAIFRLSIFLLSSLHEPQIYSSLLFNCCSEMHSRGICRVFGELQSCVCDSGSTGPDCGTEASSCPNGCSGHGVCGVDITSALPQCQCELGYTGVDCGIVEGPFCPNNCSSRGNCNQATSICTCLQGASGLSCELSILTCSNECAYGVCRNGACEVGRLNTMT